MVDSQRRAGYLEALGIDVWVPRLVVPQVSAFDWHDFNFRVSVCKRCSLHTGRIKTVVGVGNPRAHWLVIGDAPSAIDDAQGEPFLGPPGDLINAMLAAIDLPREAVFMTQVLKCKRPVQLNTESIIDANHAQNCLPYLAEQIENLQPRIILIFGIAAAQAFLQTGDSLDQLRSKVHYYGKLATPVVVTFHPEFLLHTPTSKRDAWEDLKFARNTYLKLNMIKS